METLTRSARGHVVGKTLEAWYCVPPDRDEPVVQVALAGCGPVWGEVRLDAGQLVVEVFGRPEGEPLILLADELREVLRLAEERLRGTAEPSDVPTNLNQNRESGHV